MPLSIRNNIVSSSNLANGFLRMHWQIHVIANSSSIKTHKTRLNRLEDKYLDFNIIEKNEFEINSTIA